MKQNYQVATYIWLDGSTPFPSIRSKKRLFQLPKDGISIYENMAHLFPEWSFDGSSTYQADGTNSDLILKPVHAVVNPLESDIEDFDTQEFIVLCEVMNEDGTPHKTNTRSRLAYLEDLSHYENFYGFGFEQEYVLVKDGRPLAWGELQLEVKMGEGFVNKGRLPAPQGPYYCGVGADRAFGRRVANEHFEACLNAGLQIFGMNAEVMPGQWEFQIGPRKEITYEFLPLRTADDLIIARWLLMMIAEKYDMSVSWSAKPMLGDWNGSGMHTNFSSVFTREENGLDRIHDICNQLALTHEEDILDYGFGNKERLTGKHETASIDTFTVGIQDRSASVRIPVHVQKAGKGYLEDRRPAANADPYLVMNRLLIAHTRAFEANNNGS